MSIDVKALDVGTIITVVGSIAVAAITSFSAYLVGKKKAQTDVQTTLNSGFEILIRELQEERVDLTKTIKEQDEKIGLLEGRVFSLRIQVISLQNRLRDHGIPPPPPQIDFDAIEER